jgi:hypothetical protein
MLVSTYYQNRAMGVAKNALRDVPHKVTLYRIFSSCPDDHQPCL